MSGTFARQRVLAGQKEPGRKAEAVSAPAAGYSSVPMVDVAMSRKAICPCGGGCPACQAKSRINISQPNDPAEIEADQIADKVMRIPVGDIQPVASHLSAPDIVHRACDVCEDEEAVTEALQRKEGVVAAAPDPPPGDPPPSIQQVIRSGGRLLDADTRSFFERRLGYDLSGVRIHTDSAAGQSARAIQATAYTLGHNIVFGEHQFAPSTAAGRRLLTHELAHVAQQRGATDIIQRQTEGLPASSLVPSLSEAPHGNQQCLLEHSCSVSASTPVSGAPLSPAEVTTRRRQVQLAIDRSRATYPIAAGNLQHWLDGTGSTRILAGSIFQATDSGVPGFLESGQLSQYGHLEKFQEGVSRRLNASDPESLLPVGTVRVLRYCNSMRAFPTTGAIGADLSIALGGFTVKSWATLRARQVTSSLPLVTQYQVTVESWRVQVCDRYDWIANAVAEMPMPVADAELGEMPFPAEAVQVTSIPGTGHSTVRLRDDWFRQLEASGGGRQYALYSEIFDAPANLRATLEGYTFNVL